MQKPLFLGMGGRVGRLIAPFLPAHAILAGRRGPGLVWDLNTGPGPLLDLAARQGAPNALVVLSGVTPATGLGMQANVALAKVAMAAAQAIGVRRVLLASSAAVYGGPPRHATDPPLRETDRPEPRHAYGRSKLAMEAAAAPFRDAGIQICALRIGNVAGADALLLNAPGPITLDRFADGDGPVRSYIGPQTLARVLLALCDPVIDLPPVLNIAAPKPVTMQALAEAAGLRWSWQPAPPAAVQRQVIDCCALATRVPITDSEAEAEILVSQWRRAQESR